jgi:hypothetical protein
MANIQVLKYPPAVQFTWPVRHFQFFNVFSLLSTIRKSCLSRIVDCTSLIKAILQSCPTKTSACLQSNVPIPCRHMRTAPPASFVFNPLRNFSVFIVYACDKIITVE